MGTGTTIGIIVLIVAIGVGGYYYYINYYNKPEVATPAPAEQAAEAAKQQQELTKEQMAIRHDKLDALKAREEKYRKLVQAFTRTEALPQGLKKNIYAFTEDVRLIDRVMADRLYNEFCRGRVPTAEDPKYGPPAKLRKARSRSAQRAPLDANLRDNSDSIYGKHGLEAGQFNIQHESGVRGSRSLEKHMSPTETTDSAPDLKRRRPNAQDTQEKTRADDNHSAFDSSPSLNNRDDSGATESSLLGNKRKENDTVASIGIPVKKAKRAIVVTEDQFETALPPSSDNTVNPQVRPTTEALVLADPLRQVTAPHTSPNFETVIVPAADLAGDESRTSTMHDYQVALDRLLSSMTANYTAAKYLEARGLLKLMESGNVGIAHVVDLNKYKNRILQIRAKLAVSKQKKRPGRSTSLARAGQPRKRSRTVDLTTQTRN